MIPYFNEVIRLFRCHSLYSSHICYSEMKTVYLLAILLDTSHPVNNKALWCFLQYKGGFVHTADSQLPQLDAFPNDVCRWSRTLLNGIQDVS